MFTKEYVEMTIKSLKERLENYRTDENRAVLTLTCLEYMIRMEMKLLSSNDSKNAETHSVRTSVCISPDEIIALGSACSEILGTIFEYGNGSTIVMEFMF